jgi:ATP-binding cassette, subfamily B, bacterial
MATEQLKRDQQIVARYTDQPTRLPSRIRHAIEEQCGDEPVQLYALADLDASLRLATTWLALTPTHLAVARDLGDANPFDVKLMERRRISAVRETPGLSCNVMTILGSPDEPALAVLRYSHRQRRAMENIRFVLDQQLRGQEVTGGRHADAEYADGVAGPIKEAQALVAPNDAAVVWRLLRYLGPYRGRVAVGMAAATAITGLSLIPPYLAGYLIDDVVGPVQSGAMTVEGAWTAAWLAVAAMAAVLVLRQASAWVRLRVMSVLGEYVARDLRTELYEHMQRLSLSFYSRKKTGSLITRVSSDTDRLWEFLAFGVVDASLSVVMLVGLSAVLIRLDWKLGLVMVVPIPALCAFIFLHGRRMNQLFTRAWRKWSRVNDVLSDTIPGMRVVKAFNQEDRERRRFRDRNTDVTGEFTRIHHAWTSFWPRLTMGIHGATVLVWMFALPRLLSGPGDAQTGLSAGTFVSFLLYMTMFVAPIEVIGQMARIMNRATSSAHRIFEVLDTEPEIVDVPQPIRLAPVRGQVTFRNVTFGYDGVRQVIRGVSFEVEPGEMIGLVGPSGGGKSTIANLIARFYDPTSGAVLVDGVDLRNVDSGHYRRQLGMVLQDPYLFHGSVLENIRYGVPGATIEQVIEAAKAANAHEFVCKLPQGYDTLVGERGHTLSGGERQRVSIARAILCDPRILILDEATSSVDTETERRIQEAVDRLITGRTVFAIAHRLSTLLRASRLFVVQGGRITESGTHAELLANPTSKYKMLYDLQRDVQRAV